MELQKHYLVTKFFAPTEALAVLQKADLVIARSGMGTLTELLSLGKPALFIPLPYGQHNEQLTNALFAQKLGIAEVAEQDSLTSGQLYATIEKMLQRLSEYTKHSADAKLLIKPDAAEHIIEVINDVTKQQNNPKK
jgi:UDP-N-acetylglucosamine--N-acetylmuramyl-(pentapeptide) pyrophosphoryl-undecaprenol N-acetylglucosamine transferase